MDTITWIGSRTELVRRLHVEIDASMYVDEERGLRQIPSPEKEYENLAIAIENIHESLWPAYRKWHEHQELDESLVIDGRYTIQSVRDMLLWRTSVSVTFLSMDRLVRNLSKERVNLYHASQIKSMNLLLEPIPPKQGKQETLHIQFR